MKTVSVQIGNSDNKLTQKEWSEFVHTVEVLVELHAAQVHFFGGSENWKPWQNVCWVFNTDDHLIESFKKSIASARASFRQDSVGYLEGETEFI